MRYHRNPHARWASTAVVLAAAAFLAGPARAATAFGVRSGVYTDADAGFVGAEAVTPVGHSWYFNPNFEYAFVERGDLFTVNGDFHVDVVREQPYYVWLGAGPALLVRENAAFESGHHSDLGVNLIAGVGFREPKIEPYLQAKATMSDDNQFVLAFGVRF